MTFTLDTSGAIHFAAPYAKRHGLKTFYRFEDLSPFAQGYVEALFASGGDVDYLRCNIFRRPGFSDLSPEALAMILADCEVAASILGRNNLTEDGAWFWNDGKRQPGFPPLTPYLGDDGKIHIKAAA